MGGRIGRQSVKSSGASGGTDLQFGSSASGWNAGAQPYLRYSSLNHNNSPQLPGGVSLQPGQAAGLEEVLARQSMVIASLQAEKEALARRAAEAER